MANDTTTLSPNSTATGPSELMLKLLKEKRAAQELQERRHQDWNENYELNRNKVKTNRLTQRQAVNIPLMKETIKTVLSKIDDPPMVDWKELGGNLQKQLYKQEIWDDNFKKKKLELKDVLDKKNVLLYGSSTKMLNPTENGVEINVLDTYDVLFDPLMDSLDVETARFIIRQNIFRPLRDILADERYTEKGKNELKTFLSTKEGIIQSSKNQEEWKKKMDRLKSMGVSDDQFPLFAAGDVIVNLSEHFTSIWSVKDKKFERRVVTYANDSVDLLNESLIDLIGVDFWPFTNWSEDPETNDIYPDAVADLVRTPNKVLNVWFSQLVENRTLRNFQMHWYDATVQGYAPQTYEPGPGRMLPAPGDPNKTIMPVDISGLDETLTAINFLTQIVERGTGATAIEKGQPEKGEQTLGEIKILVGKAMERAVGMAKFYRASWYELARKWSEMLQANPPAKINLHKQSRSGKMYGKVLYPADWVSKDGYEPMIRSTSEQEHEQTKGIQKFQFVLSMFPNNPALRRIAQKRTLEIVDLTPEEMREVEESERQAEEQAKQAAEAELAATRASAVSPAAPVPTQPQPTSPSPEDQALLSGISEKLRTAEVL